MNNKHPALLERHDIGILSPPYLPSDGRNKKAHAGLEFSLGRYLCQLGITPFTPGSVEAYKNAMCRERFRASGRSAARWRFVPVEDYTKNIPHMVLGTINHVHARCPSVQFYVEELIEHSDRLLKVAFGHEEYYVEVWEKPKLNSPRMA